MPLATRFRLSPLPEVAAFLVQHVQRNDELQAALDDGLEDYTQGAEVVLEALRAGLDEWLSQGHEVHYLTNEFTEPYKWLAIGDHLEAVQTFRDLL